MSTASADRTVVDTDRLDDALSQITPDIVRDHESRGAHPTEMFRSLLGTGLGALVLAEDAEPGSRWAFCSLIATISETWLSLGESIHYQVLAACTVAMHGTDEQKSRYLDAMETGRSIGGNCFNEPNAGSDLASMETVAVRDGTGFVIDGTKSWIGHAPFADVFNVYAKTRDTGLSGISCFLVPRDTPGIAVTPRVKTAGALCLPSGDVRFDEVRVGADAVLGRVNRGIIAGQELFTQGRLGLASCAIGLSRAALSRARAYASSRTQFGQSIGTFQGIAFPIAEASTELAAAEALLQRACESVESGGADANLLSAQAKLKAAGCARFATDVAVKVLASAAFDEKESALRWCSEAHLLEIVQGTPEIQKLAISSLLR